MYVIQSISLPKNVIDEINTIFYRFIWKKDNIAWERVKRNILCKKRLEGGLDMINMHNFQDSFLIQWACRLINENNEDWTILPNILLRDIGSVKVFNSKIDLKHFQGIENIKSKFWKSVVTAWIRYNTQKDELIKSNDPINNNINLTVNNQTLFMERSLKRKIILIEDVLENNEIISFEKFESKVGKHPSNLIEYTTMKIAISKIKENMIIDNREQEVFFREDKCKSLSRKKIYEIIAIKEPNFCEQMWERKIGNQVNENIWNNMFKSIKEIKLLEIQWKILQNVFPTNILLNRIGIKQSENCDFCDNQRDYVEHYFFQCTRLLHFWAYVSNHMSIKLNKKIILNKYNILLGFDQGDQMLTINEIIIINKILAIAKFSIIKSKHSNLNSIIIFENELRWRKTF